MSVISVTEIWQGRSGREQKDWTVEYTRVFRVVTDNPLDDANVVRYGTDPITGLTIPLRGDVYSVVVGGGISTDVNAKVVETSVVQSAEDRCDWHVTTTYSTSQDAVEDPTTEPTKTTNSTEFIEKAIAWDYDDSPITNSAFEEFENPPTEKIPVEVIKMKCTRATYSYATDKKPYLNKVNSMPFHGFASRQVICENIEVDEVEKLGTTYKEFTYTFKARDDEDDPWNYKPLDQGYVTWDAINEKQIDILTRDGQFLTRPALLDGNGARLAVWDGAEPVFLNFRTHESVDFLEIDFP